MPRREGIRNEVARARRNAARDPRADRTSPTGPRSSLGPHERPSDGGSLRRQHADGSGPAADQVQKTPAALSPFETALRLLAPLSQGSADGARADRPQAFRLEQGD